MNVNFSQPNFMGRNFITKKFAGELSDSSIAHVKVTFNDKMNITELSSLALKNGKITGGQECACANGLPAKEVKHFFEKLQKDAQIGVDFLREFAKSMIS